ncbi:EXS family-domain-containing protein, partial [Gorgonomyces haynaldii]
MLKKLIFLAVLLICWNWMNVPLHVHLLFFTTISLWSWTLNLYLLNIWGVNSKRLLQESTSWYQSMIQSLMDICVLFSIMCILLALSVNLEDLVEWISLSCYILGFAFLFNPTKSLYHRERQLLLQCLYRSVFEGINSQVFLSDVILCDILTSFSRVIGDMPLVMQDLFFPQDSPFHPSSPWSENHQPNFISDMIVLLCLSSPYLFRLRQCLAEARQSKGIHKTRHILNAIKYFSAFPVMLSSFFLGQLRQMYAPTMRQSDHERLVHIESTMHQSVTLWAVFACINSLYSLYWDIYMDWQLGNVSKAYLRSKLHFRPKIVYYLAILGDLVLRFVWTLKIPMLYQLVSHWTFQTETGLVSQNVSRFDMTLITLELFRRWMWVFFRLERDWVNGDYEPLSPI